MKSLVVILVLKLVEPIGKKFDKKKPVKEDLTQIDELINPNINLPFGGDRITHNHGGQRRSWWSQAGLGAYVRQQANRKKKKEEEEEKKKQEEEKKKQSKTTNESITAAP